MLEFEKLENKCMQVVDLANSGQNGTTTADGEDESDSDSC